MNFVVLFDFITNIQVVVTNIRLFSSKVHIRMKSMITVRLHYKFSSYVYLSRYILDTGIKISKIASTFDA